MKVIEITQTGISPEVPSKFVSDYGTYWRFFRGQYGWGVRPAIIPLDPNDFPPEESSPGPDQDYNVVSGVPGWDLVLTRGDGSQPGYLVMLSFEPLHNGIVEYGFDGNAEILMEGKEKLFRNAKYSIPCPFIRVTGPCRIWWRKLGEGLDEPVEFVAIFDGERWEVRPQSVNSTMFCDVLFYD